MKKNMKFWILVLAIIIIGSVAGGLGKIIGNSIVSPFSSSNSAEAGGNLDINFLKNIADKINKRMGLPKMVDNETKLVSVGYAESALIYNYVLVNYNADNVDKEEANRILKESVLSKGACKQFGKYILNNGLIVRYKYYGKNNGLIANFDIRKDDCFY